MFHGHEFMVLYPLFSKVALLRNDRGVGAYILFFRMNCLPLHSANAVCQTCKNKTNQNDTTMKEPLIECVPNISEGCDLSTISDIADAIRSVEGVRLLNVDPGKSANRTVYTFVGAPKLVAEAAFRMTQTAIDRIDMRLQHGTHPRIGVVDVLPLVPIQGISLEETARLAVMLAGRLADDLLMPCYLYEAAARVPEHRNLATCRVGEYEGLAERIASGDPRQMPDLGCRPWDERLARTGCSVVGARPFLVAVNFNLDTANTAVAKDIARAVRQRGYQGHPGTLPGTKAIGWYIEEYGFAQVSMNLCDLSQTSLYEAFAEVRIQAERRGHRVTGTEIIGLVPRWALVDAGQHFAPQETDEQVLMHHAVRSLGLEQISPFVVDERII